MSSTHIVKAKAFGHQSKHPLQMSTKTREKLKEEEELMNLKGDIFKKSKLKSSGSYQAGLELTYRSMNMRKKSNKEEVYKKNDNLNLKDYLSLTLLSKRSKNTTQNNNQNKQIRSQSQQPRLERHDTSNSVQKNKNVIDAVTSIKVVRDETKNQMIKTCKNLNKFLTKLQKSQHVRSDEQSLVFMCNVLHIFEDNIMRSIKYAQQLIDERKRQKNKQELKDFGKNSYSMIRRGGKGSRTKNSTSQIRDTSRSQLSRKQSITRTPT